MNKYSFEYKSHIYDDESNNDLFPEFSNIRADHEFVDGSTWVPILWQFCKFLESTGYVGVTDKVIINSNNDYHGSLFKTFYEKEEPEEKCTEPCGSFFCDDGCVKGT